MLSKTKSEMTPLECTFPLGIGTNQSFAVNLSGCENPLCDCQEIRLEMESLDPARAIQSLGLTLDLSNRTAIREDDITDGVYDAFLNEMNSEDWSLLDLEYYIFKARATLGADLDTLEPAFPIYDVEENSVLIGYEQVLPFQPVTSFELDGAGYFAMDMYCVNRRCHCSTVHLSIISDDKAWCDKDDFLLAVDLKTGNHKVEAQKGRGKRLKPENVLHEILQVIELKELRERYHRMRKWYKSHFDKVQVQGRWINSLHSQTSVPVSAAVAVGRNDPCPCGSGKKYKKCCLNGGKDIGLLS